MTTLKQIYNITNPTGKIYVGKDSIGSHRYMGSPDMDVVNADFANLPPEARRSYSVHKEILWESETATEAELSAKEVEFIRQFRSNELSIGYNRWPKPAEKQ
ncbi:MAG: GIY-YIG nuclease family protein [Gammaproteobacteria bacterium]|nr:GIY-YIG nuclease family protein [Gammaproteobacteria bacterium]